jgi:gliding motility-associated-like protein
MHLKVFVCLFLILLFNVCKAQTNDPDCVNATLIDQVTNFCSADAQYTTTATQTTTWFKFVATKLDVTINVTGTTLTTPVVELFANCAGNELVGSVTTNGNITSFYKGGLTIGNTYYIAVSSGSTLPTPGAFKICINNYNPVLQAGQDYATASLLCSTQTISQIKVAGAGLDNNESKGTCLDNPGSNNEQNTVWYKWQAANNGTLVFTITPTKNTDDIDFVLYDLDITGDYANVNPIHAIRCAAGNGVSCTTGPVYYKTGLDFNEIDISEAGGCGQGQNGKVKFITMQQGHYYALLINNFISQNNGFTLDFKDQNGVAGTGLFVGPKATIDYTAIDTCAADQEFIFSSSSTNYASLKWNFGTDANIASTNGVGPYTVTYSSPGIKTVTLEATTNYGCVDVDFKTFSVAQKPPAPQINANKPSFCLGDNLILSVKPQPGYTYHWAGPDNFTADSPSITIKLINKLQAGTYTVYQSQFNCVSDPVTVTISPIYDTPIASFYTQPALPAKLSVPVDITFFNQSANADNYLWDFGDGQTSTEFSPVHHYTTDGTYKVTLTAFRETACSVSITKGEYVLLANGGLFIPNTFTPNGDGVNDEFVISLTNLNNFRIQIYNRYGQPLFQSQSTFVNWDGTYNNNPVPVGVYYYVIKATDFAGNPVNRTGYVTVIR